MSYSIKIFVLTLAWTLVHSDNHFFLQKSPEGENEAFLAAAYTRSKGKVTAKCELITDNNQIRQVLASPANVPVRRVSENEMESLLKECSKIVLVKGENGNEVDGSNESTEYGRKAQRDRRQTSEGTTKGPAAANTHPSAAETTTAGYDGWPVIFPGTKWCGAGDVAENYDDLGLHQDTDRCCRAHDLCNDTLAPGETRNKLTNTSPFTKLSCQCDNDFYDCLDRVNSVTSNTIGNMYFNILKRECYAEDYPLKYPKKCKKYLTILKLTCIEWEKNTKGPKVLQWIPAKKYKRIPFPGPLTVTLPSWG